MTVNKLKNVQTITIITTIPVAFVVTIGVIIYSCPYYTEPTARDFVINMLIGLALAVFDVGIVIGGIVVTDSLIKKLKACISYKSDVSNQL